MAQLPLKNKHLYSVLKNHVGRQLKFNSVESQQILVDYVISVCGTDYNINDKNMQASIRGKVRGFCASLSQKWKDSNRTESKFIQKQRNWLELNFYIAMQEDIPINEEPVECQNPEIEAESEQEPEPSTSRGRPIKQYEQLCERSKRRKIEELKANVSAEEIIGATKSILYTSGNRVAADLLSDFSEVAVQAPKKLRQFIRSPQSSGRGITPFTDDEALAYFITCRMTKFQYMVTRAESKKRGADIYPMYQKLTLAKKRCYPIGIVTTEFGSYIPMQHLLNHTVQRIIDSVDFPKENFEEIIKIKLISKWGCDGSSGHSEYMQNFSTDDIEGCSVSDANLFMFSMVPLRLVAYYKNNISQNIWTNLTPSSTRYCRPISFKYQKETTDSINVEVNKIEEEIRALTNYEVSMNECKVQVSFELIFTMIDGKVINALTGTSSQTCYICGCKPTMMNNLQQIEKYSINHQNLKYGLSTLHAWIKFLECMLHISYKLNCAETTKRLTDQQKKEVDQRKKLIQSRLWIELSIKVDKVTQGAGTSNTGNVARSFFKNPEKTSEITGINVELLKRISTILSVISCGHEIDDQKFDTFAMDTAKLYVKLYNWYRMPPSVHKILIHGSAVIKYAILPIGTLSEEAQECRNKDYKRLREHHSRKMSRETTNTDLINNLLISSDPLITSLSSIRKKVKSGLTKDMIKLLIISDIDDYMTE